MRLGLFGSFCFAGCAGSLACWPGAGGATMDGWLAPYIRAAYFVSGHSGTGHSGAGHSDAGHSYPAYRRWVGLAGAGGWMLLSGRWLAYLLSREAGIPWRGGLHQSPPPLPRFRAVCTRTELSATLLQSTVRCPQLRCLTLGVHTKPPSTYYHK